MKDRIIFLLIALGLFFGLLFNYIKDTDKRKMKKYAIQKYLNENTDNMSIEKINKNHEFCYFVSYKPKRRIKGIVIEEESFDKEGYYKCLSLGEEEYRKFLKERFENNIKTEKENRKEFRTCN